MKMNTTHSKHKLSAVVIFCIVILAISCTPNMMKRVSKQKTNFNAAQIQMIAESGPSTPMRVFKINNTEDSLLLRTKSEDIDMQLDDPYLEPFVNRLLATVKDSMSLGVGIAAPQVGILKNIVWVQRFDKENFPFEVYINPKIIQYSQKTMTRREGCLSIPDRRDTLNCRSYAILLDYYSLDKSHHVEMVEDFTSIIFQHEVDHLNGILYTDHLKKELEDSKQTK